MISYDPNGYSKGNVRNDVNFYVDLLAGINQFGTVVVSPFTAQSSPVLVADNYLNMATIANGPTVAAPTQRVLFHGNLYMSLYCSLFIGAGSVDTFLYQNGIPQNIDRRVIAAESTAFTVDIRFESIVFDFVRVTQTGPGNLLTSGIHFTGVKITY